MAKVRGTKTMLLGPPGAGKTYSISTLVQAGLETFVLFTDPGGEESLLDAMRDRKLPMDKLHYKYVAPASPKWATLKDMAKKINIMGYNDLAGLKSGINKSDYQQFFDLLDTLANFTCEHCGKEFGPVDDFGADKALVVDSLSGINVMVMDMTIGAKPTAHQGEWGVAMNAEEKLILKLTSDLDCFFVLTAHIEKEMDETIGKPMSMAGALGRKLAPKLPRTFSDVVLAKKEGKEFYWSTTESNIDLKNRTLAFSGKISPSFVQIVEAWKKRNKETEVQVQTEK